MIGAGIGLTVPPMTSALLATVDCKQSGVASGVPNTTRQVGSVIGVALFGALTIVVIIRERLTIVVIIRESFSFRRIYLQRDMPRP
jgi:MFS transporter, DHA2 family, methylenomycin A resistance protein